MRWEFAAFIPTVPFLVCAIMFTMHSVTTRVKFSLLQSSGEVAKGHALEIRKSYRGCQTCSTGIPPTGV
jgi:hypothetical protein